MVATTLLHLMRPLRTALLAACALVGMPGCGGNGQRPPGAISDSSTGNPTDAAIDAGDAAPDEHRIDNDGGDAGLGPDGVDIGDSEIVARDAGTDASEGGAGTTPSIGRNVGCTATATLWSGPETVIDVFPVKEGIVLVTPGDVVLLDRLGSRLKSYTPPRPLTAAAFDGVTMALADGAFVTAMTTALEPKGKVELKEPCQAAVMISANRFVCGPKNDWDRLFYTYDLVQLVALGVSSKYTHKNIPMRRLPGRDHFVTPGPNLFGVDPSGATYLLGEPPTGGSLKLGPVFGFAGRPATHIVGTDGLMAKVFGDQCDPMSTVVSFGGCFQKDGNVGTLWNEERFVALTNDETRDLMYAVVSKVPPGTFPVRPTCMGECKVQRIDPVRRMVVGQRGADLPIASVVTTHHDQHCQMLALLYKTEGADSMTRLDLLEHGGE